MNKMKKILLTIFLSSLLFFTGADSVSACSCVQPSSPSEELQKSSAVFMGTVVNIDSSRLQKAKRQIGLGSSMDPVEVTFDVSKSWKGPKNKNITVKTARSSASCGYNFEQGKEYLVYANESDEGLNVSLCSRTSLASEAEEDVSKLGKSYEPEISSEKEQSLLGSNLSSIAVFLIILIALSPVVMTYILNKK